MSPPIPLITAQFVTAPSPQVFSGKGVVEQSLGNGQFVIAAHSGKVTVEITSGSLAQGDVVVFKVHGKELLIEKIPAAIVSKPSYEDAFEPLTNPTFAEAKATMSFPIAGNRGTRIEGFYYFDSIEAALAWMLSANANVQENDRQRLAALFRDSPVVVHIDGGTPDGRRCSVMSLEKASAEAFRFVKTTLNSPLWEALSPEALMGLLAQRGSLPVARLIDIDSMVSSAIQAPLASGGENAPRQAAAWEFVVPGNNAASLAVTQWLAVACDQKTPLSALSAVPPLYTSTLIPEMFEKVVALQQPPGGTVFSDIDVGDFTINETIAATTTGGEPALYGVLKRLGLDFEHSLSLPDASNGSSAPLPPNLKLLLLRAIGEHITDDSKVKETALESSRKEMALAVNQVLQRASQTGLTGKTENADAARPASREIIQLLEGFAREAEGIVKKAIGALSAGVQKPRGSAPAENNQSAVGPEVSDNAAIKDIVAKLDTLARGAVQQLLRQLKAVSDEVAARIQKFSLYTEDMPDAVKSTARRRLSDEASIAISKTVHELSANIEQASRAITSHVERVISEATRLVQTLSNDGSPKTGQPAADGLRQNLESMLQRVESLQILAKPAATAQGEQQLLILPMKIDGRWNDVIVQFVKNNNGNKKKSSRKHISVSISVAPVFLGEILVTMDYASNRNLKIRMQFEKDQTRTWFEKNKPALAGAVEKLGFQLVQIVLQQTPRQGKGSETVLQADKKGLIDIVV